MLTQTDLMDLVLRASGINIVVHPIIVNSVQVIEVVLSGLIKGFFLVDHDRLLNTKVSLSQWRFIICLEKPSEI